MLHAGDVTKPPSGEVLNEQKVKEIFKAAIESSGYRVGANTDSTLNREAPKIAATFEEMKDVKTYVDKATGKENGFCHAFYANGQIQRMGYFKEGVNVGPWRFYFPDGTPSFRKEFDSEGREVGQQVAYWRNGNINSGDFSGRSAWGTASDSATIHGTSWTGFDFRPVPRRCFAIV